MIENRDSPRRLQEAARNYRGEWRVTIDQGAGKTPWYLVEQTFRLDTGSAVPFPVPRVPFAPSPNFPEPFRGRTAVRSISRIP